MNKTTINGLTKLRNSLEDTAGAIENRVDTLREKLEAIEDAVDKAKTCTKCGNTARTRVGVVTEDEQEEIDTLDTQAGELEDVQRDLQEYIDAADTLLTMGYENTISFLENQYPEVKI